MAAPPILAVVILGLVVVAAALLIAGLGAPVGIGLLVGMTLGFVAVGVMVVLSRRDSAQGVSWSVPMSDQAPDAHADLVQHYGQSAFRVADVDSGALTRVIALGTDVTATGVRIELVADELRADGGLATLAAHTRPPAAPLGHFVDITVSDDIGTEYVAAGQAAGSSMSATRLEVRFAPAPPPGARALTLAIERFVDPFIQRGPAAEGPWSFDVSL